MLNTRFYLLIFTFLFSVSSDVSGQSKKWLMEARRSMDEIGVSGRYFFNKSSAVDLIFGMPSELNNVTVTALYEEHSEVKGVKGLSWYAGAGLHTTFNFPVAVKEPDNGSDAVLRKENKNSVSSISFNRFGADAIIGIRYKFGKSPVSIATDLKPFVNFMNEESALLTGNVRLGLAF